MLTIRCATQRGVRPPPPPPPRKALKLTGNDDDEDERDSRDQRHICPGTYVGLQRSPECEKKIKKSVAIPPEKSMFRPLLDNLSIPRHGKSSSEPGSVMI